MIIRVRFFDDSKKAFITEWTLCKADSFVTLSTLYDNIYSGDIPCGLKVEITYDREKLWVESTSTNSNQPLTEELFNTPLEFTIGDLEDNRKKVFVIFHVSERCDNSVTSGGLGTSAVEVVDSPPGENLRKNAFDILLNSTRELCVPNRKIGKKQDIIQYNKNIQFLEDDNYTVQRCDIKD